MKLLKTISFALVLSATPILSQAEGNTNLNPFASRAAELQTELVELRRDFHRHPEVAGEEVRTAQKVAEYLEHLGLEVTKNLGGHGVIGLLKGAKPGKTVVWRADMDAMHADEPDPVSFKSEIEGKRHICGHDVHTTIGLGIAKVLSERKNELAGNIYFLFQPAEETLRGAADMIQDGVLDLMKANEIYGAHVSPLQVGVLSAKPNMVYADWHHITIRFQGNENKTEIAALIDQIMAGQQRTTTDVPLWKPENYLHPEYGVANPNTVYKDYLLLSQSAKTRDTAQQLSVETSFRTTDTQDLAKVLEALRSALAESPYADRMIDIHPSQRVPAVTNDANLTAASLTYLQSLEDNAEVGTHYGALPFMTDDFAYFQQKVPGVYFFLGGSNFQQGVIAAPHTPNFQVDESAIEIGVRTFAALLSERAAS